VGVLSEGQLPEAFCVGACFLGTLQELSATLSGYPGLLGYDLGAGKNIFFSAEAGEDQFGTCHDSPPIRSYRRRLMLAMAGAKGKCQVPPRRSWAARALGDVGSYFGCFLFLSGRKCGDSGGGVPFAGWRRRNSIRICLLESMHCLDFEIARPALASVSAQ
jgi:hypothetical protein